MSKRVKDKPAVKEPVIKRIETIYNPSAVSSGNDGQIVYVPEKHKALYKKAAIYRLTMNGAYIEVSLRYLSRSKVQKYCIKAEWLLNSRIGMQTAEATAETYEEALKKMEKTILNILTTYRDKLQRIAPWVYEKEGQIDLF